MGLMGTRLGKFVNAMASARAETIEYAAYNQSVLTKMSELNREQMNEEGVFSDGSSTPDYAPFTVEEKKRKGQRYDHMTFRDTGGTQRSIVYLFNGDLVADWTDYNDILGYLSDKGLQSTPIGLTQESMDELKPEIAENVRDYILSKL